MSLAPQYRCHKVVTALQIIDYYQRTDSTIAFCVKLEDGTHAEFDRDISIATRYTPKPGDMLVFYTEESFEFELADKEIRLPEHLAKVYVSISPRAEFEAGYAHINNFNKPLDRTLVRERLRDALYGKTDFNQTEQHCALLKALLDLHTEGIIRNSGKLSYHVPTKCWHVAIGTALYVVGTNDCTTL